ncbi:MAG: TRAP transporter small permease subunit [Gammaproteobacteria bacterium]|nr:TRAP transporter small permease subunit [Gammaproteobacteria bacterium]
MSTIDKITHKLDMISEYAGRTVAWFVLLLALLTLLVALPRYLLSNESFMQLNLFWLNWEDIRLLYSSNVNAMSDGIQFLHATIFMVGISYAMKSDDHVQIDIIYRNLSARSKAWVNILGMLLLFYPTFIFIWVMSWQYVLNSWSIFESSSRPGGLQFIFVLKTFLLIMPAMMILQGSALLLRNIQILRKQTPEAGAN